MRSDEEAPTAHRARSVAVGSLVAVPLLRVACSLAAS